MLKFYNITVLTEIVCLKVPDRLWTLGEVCPFKSLRIARGFLLLSQFFYCQENLQTTTLKVGQLHKPMHVSRITFYDLHRRTGETNTSWTSGDCPLTLCVCSICALPVRTCLFQLWPRFLSPWLGQHSEASINPKITCCGIQAVSLSYICVRNAALVCVGP